jgi:hypothetical protein
MGAAFDLANRAEAQLLQGRVIELAAVVLAHAGLDQNPDHNVNLLVNGLVTADLLLSTVQLGPARSGWAAFLFRPVWFGLVVACGMTARMTTNASKS